MTVTLLEGHVLAVLAGLPAGRFHVCVCSPPYWLLRSYSTAPQVWDAGEGCDHAWGEEVPGGRGTGGPQVEQTMWRASGTGHDTGVSEAQRRALGAFCVHCHAWRGELGQEPSPELFVEHLVAVFRAVKRVLRPDGTLWVNLAGCYFNDPGGQNGASLRNGQGATGLAGGGGQRLKDLHAISQKAVEANRALGRQKRGRHPWLKPLDWVDVPGMFAQAMQRDGWLWRSDVTWIKPSALPESVSGTRFERCRVKVKQGEKASAGSYKGDAHPQPRSPMLPGGVFVGEAEWADCPGCPRCSANEGLVLRRGSGRPTKATERILLFTRGPGYYFDQDGVREPSLPAPVSAVNRPEWEPRQKDGGARESFRMDKREYHPMGRNLRDWWVIGPEPLKDAHYAAYPSRLPERCILAGTSEWGCCPSCGAPWARVIARQTGWKQETTEATKMGEVDLSSDHRNRQYSGGMPETETTTLGWRPTCGCRCQECDDEAGFENRAGACAYCDKGVPKPQPCRVLDPFGGSGTTALAANRLGRDCTLVELKPGYADLARKRLGREPLSLWAWQGQEALEPAGEEAAPLEKTKQEAHPNRTVAGFNQRYRATALAKQALEEDGA